MKGKVARRPRRGKPPAVAAAKRRAQQRQVRATIRTRVATVVQTAVEEALQVEVEALLGRGKYARRRTAPLEAAEVACTRCRLAWRPRLQRAGSYRRTLLTLAAAVEIRVPRVACRCGGTVRLEFATLAPYARTWGEVEERGRELAALCISLRDARTILAWESGQPVAASTVQRWTHAASTVAEALRAGPLPTVPPVVLLDGLWVKLLVGTGEWYTDRQGRRRERQRRVKVVLLVAYGVDPTTGARGIIDWERASGEDQASWQRLLERLHARGLRADNGLALFVHDGSAGLEEAFGLVDFGPGVLRQRCIWHVLKNLREAVQGDAGMKRAAKQARRREVLEEAAAIWQATDPTTVARRARAFRTKWAAREPQVVARLTEHWGRTRAYLTVIEQARERGETWDPRYLRTTSLLERVNRALRQKARQAGAFHSARGVVAALGLVCAHRGLAFAAPPTDLWTEVLEVGLLAS